VNKYASRAGEKLEHALNNFDVPVKGVTCADFGSSTGGFVDCLLQHGAEKVYAIETGYGILDWKLRNNPKVIVIERQNAMHVILPEKVDLITIDTSWTKLKNIVPNAIKNLKESGFIISLVKPHYEAEPRMLRKGTLLEESIGEVLGYVRKDLADISMDVLKETESPLKGEKGGNKEFIFLLKAHLAL